jgi:nitrate reductase NapD
MQRSRPLARRTLLKGRTQVYVASAVVLARPGREEAVAAEITCLRGVEVHARASGRLVVVLEADTSGEIGALLAAIAGLPGVLAANLVFEQVDDDGGSTHDR